MDAVEGSQRVRRSGRKRAEQYTLAFNEQSGQNPIGESLPIRPYGASP